MSSPKGEPISESVLIIQIIIQLLQLISNRVQLIIVWFKPNCYNSIIQFQQQFMNILAKWNPIFLQKSFLLFRNVHT